LTEPINGHAKNDGLLGRNWLGPRRDRSNALLAELGFNLRQLFSFLRGRPFCRDFFYEILVHAAHAHFSSSLRLNFKINS